MKKITLTKVEERLLVALLWTNPCASGCAFEEMQKSSKDCCDCPLTLAKESLANKLD